MTKTLIIPGLDGSPEPHWQHWWAQTDPNAVSVELTQSQKPVPALWEIELAQVILQYPDSVLVGHSLGAVLIARLLSTWPHLQVKAAMLVAPAEPGQDNRLQMFGCIPETKLGIPAIVVASRNDPWMSFSRAKALASIWQADLVDYGFAGHINVASGFGPWHAGLDLRNDLLIRAVRPGPDAIPQFAGMALQ